MTSIRSASGHSVHIGQGPAPDTLLRLVFDRGPGKRAKGTEKQGSKTTYVRPATETHKNWAMLIKRVYEVDPLECPNCDREIKIVSFISGPRVIFQILDHLDILEEPESYPPRGPNSFHLF